MRQKRRQKRQSEPFDGDCVSSEELCSFAFRAYQNGNQRTGDLIAEDLYKSFRGWLIRQRPTVRSEAEARTLFFDYVRDYGGTPHRKSIITELSEIIRERAASQGTQAALEATADQERRQESLQALSYHGTGPGTFERTQTSTPERIVLQMYQKEGKTGEISPIIAHNSDTI